jgi:sialate O-acetylesterase
MRLNFYTSKSRNANLALIAVLAFSSFTIKADVALNSIFSDHMVIQRDRPVPVWGTASPNEKVSITFNGSTKSTTAQSDGKWMVTLAPQVASMTPQTLSVQGNNKVDVSDVLVGDVWVGTGQSNMDFPVTMTDGKDRIQHAPPGQFDGIRLLKVPETESDQPAQTINAHWTDASTPNVMEFSATLFYFAESLREKMPGVPLGLIRSSVGATNIYSWIPTDLYTNDPSAEYLRGWWTRAKSSWTQEKQDANDKAVQDYEAQKLDYQEKNEPMPASIRNPGELLGPKWSRRPCALYNGMIAPLSPFAIRGMIWYQGEWDAKNDWVKTYHDMFLAMAKSWRSAWAAASNDSKAGDFPIYVVQLPSREAGDGNYWPFMREVEANLGSDVPNSGFVVTMDLNDGTNLHPPEKTEIGRRLARLALAKEYGQKNSYYGPTLKSATVDGSGMVLTFDSGGGALTSSDGQPLRNFELAADEGKYYPATAQISGNTIRIESADVPQPASVRYGWKPAHQPMNFFNAEQLPASPFRTDSQPVQ